MPGPDLVLVTRGVLTHGRRGGVMTALGIASGSSVWALASAAGLAALLAASPDLLGVIRILGALYLAWLGLRALIAGPEATPSAGARAWGRTDGSSLASFRVGFISNLLHPGQAVFYTSMLPQFIDPARDTTLQALLLGAIFVVIALLWFSLYAVIASRIGVRRWVGAGTAMRRITGVVLIAFAIRLAARW